MKFIIATLLSLVSASESDYCRVLALRGGGTNGAFEIGVLKKMVEYLPPSDLAYDVF